MMCTVLRQANINLAEFKNRFCYAVEEKTVEVFRGGDDYEYEVCYYNTIVYDENADVSIYLCDEHDKVKDYEDDFYITIIKGKDYPGAVYFEPIQDNTIIDTMLDDCEALNTGVNERIWVKTLLENCVKGTRYNGYLSISTHYYLIDVKSLILNFNIGHKKACVVDAIDILEEYSKVAPFISDGGEVMFMYVNSGEVISVESYNSDGKYVEMMINGQVFNLALVEESNHMPRCIWRNMGLYYIDLAIAMRDYLERKIPNLENGLESLVVKPYFHHPDRLCSLDLYEDN